MPSEKKDKSKKTKPKSKSVLFHAPRGMHDVLPSEQHYWEKIESATKDIASYHNFLKLNPPVLEFADLFNKTTGDDSDVVTKEMYTLRTKGGDFLALRPEFTPSNARAYMEHGLSRLGQPQRLYNLGPVFRHERPQKARLRQFTQINFEVIGGVNDPIYDAQIISVFMSLLSELKIKDMVLKINSIGCRICRPIYIKQLQNFYKDYEKVLCSDCVRRLKSNPLRLLDCKTETCAKLREKTPSFLNKLCATCSNHFKCVLEYLDELQISYSLDSRLVRGLDYYNRTVFEIFADGVGGEIGALPAGGRYDYLMEMLGGHLTPAVGGAVSVERLIAVMKKMDIQVPTRLVKRVFLIHAGESSKKKTLKLARDLQSAGIPVSEALVKVSLSAQLKSANKEKASVALILGQKEIYEKSVIVRDMRTGLQDNVSLDKIVEELKKRLRQK